jgi:tetratricopeptide (TPR) repeat protein
MAVNRTIFWILALSATFIGVSSAKAQSPTVDVEGHLRAHGRGQIIGLRVRLTRQNGSRQFSETYSESDGRFAFRQVSSGDYLVEILESSDFLPAAASVSIQASPSINRTVVSVLIDLMPKPSPNRSASVVMADVDTKVPQFALKHYVAGLKGVESKDSDKAISEFKAAIEVYPTYYAARLELGREFRTLKRFQEAAETLKSLSELAPTRAEPHLEYALVLLGLGSREESIKELRTAIELEEQSWAPHYFLGLALFDSDGAEAAKEFQRAIELNEKKAARAHVALARLLLRKGEQKAALKHLDTYLALEPNAPDAETVRKFADRLRTNK